MTVLRTLKRRYGIAAPRVAVRTHVPWYMRWMLLLVLTAVVSAIAWATFEFGLTLAGFHSGKASTEHAKMTAELSQMQQENTVLRGQIAALERQMQIEQVTHDNLTQQMKSLGEENALLKNDLALFQTLMVAGADNEANATGISINRFQVQPGALPGEYRYRLLVVQARQRSKEFRGELQLVVDLLADGQAQVLTLPRPNEPHDAYNLNFRFYQRVEGVFTAPANTVVKRVQVKVMEVGADTPRSSRTINLS